jgi:hypothetical protein
MIPGLLVAACVNIAPEGTFGAAVAEVGVLDLLKVRVVVLAIFIPAQHNSYSLLILRLVRAHDLAGI